MIITNRILLALLLVLFTACAGKTSREKEQPVPTDPLAAWNETATKKAIIDYVAKVTDANSSYFVPREDRIAVFDNDGTLWCEQPTPEVPFSFYILREEAKRSPEWMKKPVVAKIVKENITDITSLKAKEIEESYLLSRSIDPQALDAYAKTWLSTATHERFKARYSELTYVPMVELVHYLQDHDFKVYIVSGGSTAFIRTFSKQLYNIEPENVIGSLLKVNYNEASQKMETLPELFFFNDGKIKAEAIFQFVGKKPILAFGNSDGDTAMLDWSSSNNPYPTLALLLHHTDEVREYAYDRESLMGSLSKGLDIAPQKGWLIVDMKKDFAKVFSFE